MQKYKVTIEAKDVVPSDYAFFSADIIVWANSANEAEEFAAAFLAPHGIGVFAYIDSVVELASLLARLTT